MPLLSKAGICLLVSAAAAACMPAFDRPRPGDLAVDRDRTVDFAVDAPRPDAEPAAVETIAEGAGCATAIAVDAERVYWAAVDGISAASKRTLEVERLVAAPLTNVEWLAVDAENLYWAVALDGADGGGIFFAPKGGVHAPTKFQEADYPRALSIEQPRSGAIYYSARVNGSVSVFCRVKDEATTVVMAEGQYQVDGFALHEDDLHLYWMSAPQGGVPADKIVSKVRCEAGPGGVAAVASGQTNVNDVASSATHLFWLDRREGKGDGALMRWKKTDASPPPPPELVAEGGFNPKRLVLDERFAYWTDPAQDRVVKVAQAAPAGSAVITVAGAQARPWAIAVDATHVYWTTVPFSAPGTCDPARGSVVRAPK